MSRSVTGVLILLAGVLLVSGVTPAITPVTTASPTSDSMVPTAPEHSLIIAVDMTPQVGDIAVFENPNRDSLVLHRLVEEVDSGEFISQGDANQLTDQATGEPVVERTDIRGVVPVVAGVPLIVPYAGIVVANPVFIIGVWGFLGVSILYNSMPSNVIRGNVSAVPVRVSTIAIGVAIVAILPIIIVGTPMVIDAQASTTLTGDTTQPYFAAPGGTTTQSVSVTSPFISILQTTVHESGDIVVTGVESELGDTTATVEFENTPAKQPTVHTGQIRVYTYPPVLPGGVLSGFANIHPLLAAIISGMLVGGPIVMFGFAMDPKRITRANRQQIKRDRLQPAYRRTRK